MKNRRWDGETDRHLWPFTFSGPSRYKRIGIMLDSGSQEGGEGDWAAPVGGEYEGRWLAESSTLANYRKLRKEGRL